MCMMGKTAYIFKNEFWWKLKSSDENFEKDEGHNVENLHDLDSIYIIINRMLVEMWILKVLLVRTQKKWGMYCYK